MLSADLRRSDMYSQYKPVDNHDGLGFLDDHGVTPCSEHAASLTQLFPKWKQLLTHDRPLTAPDIKRHMVRFILNDSG